LEDLIPVQQIISWDEELIHQKMVARKWLLLSNQLAFVQKERIFLTNTGAAAVKIVSPTEALADFLKHNSMLYTSHGIHSNQPPDLLTVLSIVEEAVSYFGKAITPERVRVGGRMSVEGPHDVSSSKAISGIRMTLEA